jgi:hypothetical protein
MVGWKGSSRENRGKTESREKSRKEEKEKGSRYMNERKAEEKNENLRILILESKSRNK